MAVPPEIHCDVPSVELLRTLVELPLPLRLRASEAIHQTRSDAYLDTSDGRLNALGITCRFRIRSGDRPRLFLHVRAGGRPGTDLGQQYEAAVDELDPLLAVQGDNEPARRLRATVDPATLAVSLVVRTERTTRRTVPGWIQRSQFELAYDIVSVERDGLARKFQELRVRRLGAGAPTLAEIAAAFEQAHGLKAILEDRLDRERRLGAALTREAQRRAIGSGRTVVLIALDRGRVACRNDRGSLRLPMADGSGAEACRDLLVTSLGSAVGDLRLIGELAATPALPHLEVWLGLNVRQHAANASDATEWLTLDELTARARTPSLRDSETVAALLVAARSNIGSLARASDPVIERAVAAALLTTEGGEGVGGGPRLLDGGQSLLEFNSRVLAMAEAPNTPLFERLNYLAIVSANTDEFFAVQVSGLKRRSQLGAGAVVSTRGDERLAGFRRRVRDIIVRQDRCLGDCLRELASHDIRLVPWSELDADEKTSLRRHARDVVFPLLTPQAVTEAPGYPRPQVASFLLSLAVLVKDPQTGPTHLAFLRIPPTLPRLVPVRDGRSFVLIEEVIRDQLDALYPRREVLQAFLFRVTRSGQLDGDDEGSGDLLQAIEEDSKRRRNSAVVRVEVEHGMPAPLRLALLRELRLDAGGQLLSLEPDDVFEIAGPLDLTMLRELTELPLPELRFPPFAARAPFAPNESVFALVAERDRLVHHPYDDFSASVLRLLEEAADDPSVTTIKMTLYRAGERSPVVEALVRAAEAGKEVSAFVELKARFDEERNVRWAKRLAEAGVNVIHGLVGLKNHAKLVLVVRRENGVLRRYVHIGTGNYNAGTARVYTDLGLFTANEPIGADVSDLFNELTGSSQGPLGNYRRLLVAPHALLPALLARIEREAEHARAGRESGIRLKVNGLSEVELIQALHRAAQAGVSAELIVRGICRLRPGGAGQPGRIRVVSILGRFLEHARIYRFANGGDPEYLIGSADWRPRNLRRRIEVVVPVTDIECRARLDGIIDRELHDPAAWELTPYGSYRRAGASADAGSVAQSTFVAEAQQVIQTADA